MSLLIATHRDVEEKASIICALEVQLECFEEFLAEEESEVAAVLQMKRDLHLMINTEKNFKKAMEFQLSNREALQMAKHYEALRAQEKTDTNYARRLGGLLPLPEDPQDPDVAPLSVPRSRELEVLDDESEDDELDGISHSLTRTSLSSSGGGATVDDLETVRLKAKFFGKRAEGGATVEEAETKLVKAAPPRFGTCYACFEENIDIVAEYACHPDHRTCYDCLEAFVKSGLKDRSLLPLRCCGQGIHISTYFIYKLNSVFTLMSPRN